ncbi:MAG TPA: phosphotransferase [Ramlibacter sp.]|jgi:hypothetical protein|nr:phosphotransferase [Ramlibacter sp.]
MLVILSGQYLESELASEFGAIPASFLPVGNKRLYTYQLSQLRTFYKDVFMTLPHDFALADSDRRALKADDVLIYRTRVGCSIGEAVRQVLDELQLHGRVDILYGDTLIRDARLEGSDWLAVGDSDEFYRWHYEQLHGESDTAAWCGMFSFSDSRRLRSALEVEPDFIRAVDVYGQAAAPLERRRVEQWLDFGHVHTYFTSKLSATTQRHFNRLVIEDGVLTKSSDDTRKMEAEAAWFQQAPASLRHYLPNYLGASDDGSQRYSLEYLPLAALNELFVFGRLPAKVWSRIFDACNRYLEAAAAVPVPPSAAPGPGYARAAYVDKTCRRLDDFARQTGISIVEPWVFNGQPVPSLLSMAQEMGEAVLREPPVPAFIHGDLCFSNILFDFRGGRIKLIDPRGLDAEGRITPYGDMRYDIAKLSHSVIGLYDVIVAGHFDLQVDKQRIDFALLDGHTDEVREAFLRKQFLGRDCVAWGCYPAMVLLFLSMLPLHADNPRRQQALMANSLRLYLETTA